MALSRCNPKDISLFGREVKSGRPYLTTKKPSESSTLHTCILAIDQQILKLFFPGHSTVLTLPSNYIWLSGVNAGSLPVSFGTAKSGSEAGRNGDGFFFNFSVWSKRLELFGLDGAAPRISNKTAIPVPSVPGSGASCYEVSERSEWRHGEL